MQDADPEYQRHFPRGSAPLDIEFGMIHQGGYLLRNGVKYGLGMFGHYRNIWSLVWPDDDHHRWSDLILKHWLENRITVVAGSRDSSKTRTLSKCALTDYFAYPDDTLILMTSTDVRGLELRVWGDIKSLHERAKDRFDWLPGNVADSKHGIFTDKIAEGEGVRDMRRGILGVPCLGSSGEYMGNALKNFCFASGTMVDTPSGARAIESIQRGDLVFSAVGISRVAETARRTASKLVRVIATDGSHVDCTPEHRFLTTSGWKDAIDISCQDQLVSTYEAMRIMSEPVSEQRQEESFLRSLLRLEMEVASKKHQEEIAGEQRFQRNWETNKCFHYEEPKGKEKEGSFSISNESIWSVMQDGKVVSRGKHRIHSKRLVGTLVQGGPGLAESKTCRGSGWAIPHEGYAEGIRRPERFDAKAIRVVDIEILESRHNQGPRNGSRIHHVHNLEVEGHPSYSVNGWLVHNCGIKQKRRRLVGDELQFIPREYLKSLDSLDKGDFRAGLLGNPIAENGKALDEVSEPIGGWDSIGEITKTIVWKNKYQGVTINLVGLDSPNFDKETPNRFSYMVDQGDVDRVTARPGGRDSLEWWSQIMGVRKVGAISNRVLTVAEIESYDGFKEPVWSGTDRRQRIYAIDAGFGGDACVRTWGEFGKLVDGTSVIAVGDQKVIPIVLSSGETPEKQIAKYAKADCAALGIPAGNVFFDAGMYATLAVEMARAMTAEVNAVNFGGPATERPVSSDMFTLDADGHTRRLKTWSEHVSKFVTELWFAVRLAAQCRQIRNFPREAAQEFGRRIWEYVSRDRYELESKDDYKARNGGESPNNSDSLVILVEGARRRGFVISKLSEIGRGTSKVDEWLEAAMLRQRRIRERQQLDYA